MVYGRWDGRRWDGGAWGRKTVGRETLGRKTLGRKTLRRQTLVEYLIYDCHFFEYARELQLRIFTMPFILFLNSFDCCNFRATNQLGESTVEAFCTVVSPLQMCLVSPESVPSAGWKLGISNFPRRPLTIDPGSLEVEQEGVQLFPNINRHRINQRLEGVNNTIIIEFIINVLKIHIYFLFFHPLNSLIDAAILVLQYSSNYKLNNNSLNEVPSYRPDSTKSLLSQRLSSYRLPSHHLPSQRRSS